MTSPFSVKDIVRLALAEDVGPGDLTTRLTTSSDKTGRAGLKARQPMVLSGLETLYETMAIVDSRVKVKPMAADGDMVAAGAELAWLEGPAAAILTGERVALNFLMRLSGVATLTRQYVETAANPAVKVIDTRKTTPGLRLLEKAAVRHGGGYNHRFALYDGILIKDNHIASAGSVAEAVRRAKAGAPHSMKIEVETDTLEQLKEALTAGAEAVLLDNMSVLKLKEAVKITEEFCAPRPRYIALEASGGVSLTTIGAIAQTGVDYISVGALTHSAIAVDIGLDWE